MADETDEPRGCPDDCEGASLETLREVRAEVARVCRLLKRGHLDPSRGHVLLTGLGIQLKALQDARDNLWTKRASVMWAEREAKNAQPAPPH